MKKLNIIVCVVLLISLSFMLIACSEEKQENIWEKAVYTENTVFGNGAKTIEIEVKAEDKSVTFTVNTDKNNLEEALAEHKLIDGEKGVYGMYIKKVNGITADYDVDQSYWALSENGESLMTGASDTEIKGGEHFEFIYTK